MVLFNLEELFKQQQRVAEAEMNEIIGDKSTLQIPMSSEDQRFVARHQGDMEDIIEPFVTELTRQASKMFRNEFFNLGIHHLAYMSRLNNSELQTHSRENNFTKKKTKRRKSAKEFDRKEPMERRWTTLNNLSVVGGEKFKKKSKSTRAASTPKKNRQGKAKGAGDPIGKIIRAAEQNVFDTNESYNEAICN